MKLLDLFCGAGGAAMGYYRAGFAEIVGVDNRLQKRYPFEFVLGDALEYCEQHGREFDMIHASPPCQAYSVTQSLYKGSHVDLVASTRRILQMTKRSYVIENVPGAPLINPIRLCGTMFPGLRVIRHRLFECEPVVWWPPSPCQHWGKVAPKGLFGTFANGSFLTITGESFLVNEARKAMGIDWMIGKELSQAIPPAYTEWLGQQIIQRIKS